MPVTTSSDGTMVTLHVDGAIDSHLGTALHAAATTALADGRRRFLVNLQKAKQANSAFALVGPPPLLADVLEATRLAQRFAVFDSTEQAIQNLRLEA